MFNLVAVDSTKRIFREYELKRCKLLQCTWEDMRTTPSPFSQARDAILSRLIPKATAYDGTKTDENVKNLAIEDCKTPDRLV